MTVPIGLIQRLVSNLNDCGIVYCHWKGNYALERVLAGDKDFELLVARQSVSLVLCILLDLGFKSAVVTDEEQTPGVSHFYGLDAKTGRLVHVHLYENLLTGESFIKSHWLPLAGLLLTNVRTIDGIRVPSRGAELISHTLRVFIKLGSLVDLIHQFRDQGAVDAEFRWLLAENDLSEAVQILKQHARLIDQDLFIECVNSFRVPTALLKRLLLALSVRWQLQPYARHSDITRSLMYLQLLCRHGVRRVAGNSKNKKLRRGGAVVAFVGPEATGKSTLVAECAQWLGGAFGVQTTHAGKPPSSWLTAPANLILPVLRGTLPSLRNTTLEGHRAMLDPDRAVSATAGLPALLYSLRAVMLAWDRRALLLGARRQAANGVIVICDRYPSETIGSMDGARLLEHPDQKGVIAALCNWLARLEHLLYEQIPAPDLALRLKVTIDTAKVRNRVRIKANKESDRYVESRHRQASDWHRVGTKGVYDVDTEAPLSETIITVKQVIWDSL